MTSSHTILVGAVIRQSTRARRRCCQFVVSRSDELILGNHLLVQADSFCACCWHVRNCALASLGFFSIARWRSGLSQPKRMAGKGKTTLVRRTRLR